ncbi:MAG: hypothetical protein KDD22_07085, partial [Bdellovibrionales bacterium]|nr:hypothetical protein [Bdellovibrionales bacterium]
MSFLVLKREFQSAMYMVFVGLALFSANSNAASLFVDLNAFYMSDAAQTTSTTSETKTFFDAAIGFGVNKTSQWQVGWNYSSYGASTTDTTYTSSEMGPKFGYYFDKDRNWGASFSYNMIVTGTNTESGTTSNWRGTSMKFD